MDLLVNVVVEAMVLALGLGIMMLQLKNITKKLDEVIKSEHECRESLPFKFALKDSVSELWARADRIDAELKYLQGRTNGKS